MSKPEDYFDTRLKEDKKRQILWKELSRYLNMNYIRPSDTVLELGAGWCDFINQIEAKHKIAADVWEGIAEQAHDGIQTIVGDATNLKEIKDNQVDVIFASNFLEHLSVHAIEGGLKEWMRILKPGGKLILIQPNFRYASKFYFDDFTHVSVWSHVSLADFLSSSGWSILETKSKFLPLTVKSRFPVRALLIRLYLFSPIKPKSGQMLLVAQNPIPNS